MVGEVEATLAALTSGDPSTNISAIKAAVTAQLLHADSSAEIKHTDYFNHTFAPDMVLSWADATRERRVYLRTDTRTDSLADDLRWISSEEPIIVPLHQVGESDQEVTTESLNVTASAANTMVANSDAFDAFERPDEARGLGLFRRSFLRGGRGLIGRERIVDTQSAIRGAFEAAQVADGEVVRTAVSATEEILNLDQAGTVNRFLQAVWVASGSPSSDFPGAIGATGALDLESLQLLLDTESMQDAEFWTRVARNVSPGRLAALRVSGENPAFQVLVEAAAPRLRIRGGYITRAADGPKNGQPSWSADGTFLIFTDGARFTLHVPPGRMSEASPEGEPLPGRGVVYTSVFDRLSEKAEVTRLTFRSPVGSTIQWEASAPSRTADEMLSQWTSSLTVIPNVESAVVQVGSGREMYCDFLAGRIFGRTNTRFWLQELLDTGARILLGGEEAVFEQLTAPLREARPVKGPPLDEVRAWARAQGLEVSERGAIPQRVNDAYVRAKQDADD